MVPRTGYEPLGGHSVAAAVALAGGGRSSWVARSLPGVALSLAVFLFASATLWGPLRLPSRPATDPPAAPPAAASAGTTDSFLGLDALPPPTYPRRCSTCSEPWEEDWVQQVCGDMKVISGEDFELSEDEDILDDVGDNSGNSSNGTDPIAGNATTTTFTTTTMLPPMQFQMPGGAFLAYWGSADLDQTETVPNSAKNLVLFAHGGRRDAKNYFCYLKQMVEASRIKPNETIMVVPKFEQQPDNPRPGELWWNGSRPWGDWRGGASSDNRSGGVVSSYAVFDTILRVASNKSRFPLLEKAVVIGHSAGGQTVHRYSLVSWLTPSGMSSEAEAMTERSLHPGLHVRYVVGNPSSYLYLDKNRWQYSCSNETEGGCTEMTYEPYEPESGRAGWREDRRRYTWSRRRTGFDGLAPMNSTNRFACQTESFNSWHYGINRTDLQANNVVPYLRDHPDLDRALEVYPFRDVIYLVGQNDTCTDGYLGFCFPSCWRYNDKCYGTSIDMRCPAMLEGPNRNYRAKNYMRHLESHYKRKVHELHEEPNIGHQALELMVAALNQLHFLQLVNGRRVVA